MQAAESKSGWEDWAYLVMESWLGWTFHTLLIVTRTQPSYDRGCRPWRPSDRFLIKAFGLNAELSHTVRMYMRM